MPKISSFFFLGVLCERPAIQPEEVATAHTCCGDGWGGSALCCKVDAWRSQSVPLPRASSLIRTGGLSPVAASISLVPAHVEAGMACFGPEERRRWGGGAGRVRVTEVRVSERKAGGSAPWVRLPTVRRTS